MAWWRFRSELGDGQSRLIVEQPALDLPYARVARQLINSDQLARMHVLRQVGQRAAHHRRGDVGGGRVEDDVMSARRRIDAPQSELAQGLDLLEPALDKVDRYIF